MCTASSRISCSAGRVNMASVSRWARAPAKVVARVLTRGAALVALGSAIGVAAALTTARVLASMLYGVGPNDPLSIGGAVGVLLVVGLLAAFVPARRASLTDPATVLRHS